MSEDKLEKKVINITGCETKKMSNGRFFSKIKDEKELTYMLFHTKVDGTDTKAYANFKDLPMSGIGCDVEVMYKEEPYEKDGQTYTSRKLLGIKRAVVQAPSVDDVKIADWSIVF